MDVIILVFLTALGFLCLFFGNLLRSNSIGSALNVIAMMVFALIAIVFMQGETITTIVYTTVPINIDMPMGLSSDHLTVLFLCLSLIAMYAEL